MGNIIKTFVILLLVGGALSFIGFRVYLGDNSEDLDVSPVSKARVHISPGKAPIAEPKNSAVSLDSAGSKTEASVDNPVLPIWDAGKVAELVVLDRAHPIYAQRIELDRTALSSLKIGDGFRMHIPQTARNLTAIVIDRVINQHSETLIASVSTEEGTFAVQFTVSGESVFGNIETPDGVFVLERQVNILGGGAVIFSEKEIYQNLDYRESDAIPLEG